MSLTFKRMRAAGVARIPQFKDKYGRRVHVAADGSDWSDSDWLQGLVGEIGEYANIRKKVQRGDLSRAEALPMMADELADVLMYLDLLCFRLGIDLEAAFIKKFNEVSRRVGSDVFL